MADDRRGGDDRCDVQLVITSAESARVDLAADEPIAAFMDRAGLAVALEAVDMGARYGSRVAILVGRGNNGGDGYVAATYLARRGCKVRLHSLGYPKGEDSPARRAATRAVNAGATIVPLGEPEPADLVIDALFGVGFRGSLPPEVVPWTRHGAPLLAVDIPSGVDADTGETDGAAFTADRTVTFHAFKPGHFIGEGAQRCGRLELVDIGLLGGEPVFMVCERDDAPIPMRSKYAHKWSAGSVLVVGGSPGLTGAALLAARAALHGGAGAVSIACPSGLASIYAGQEPSIMTVPVGRKDRFGSGDVELLIERAARYDVLVVGPGLGVDREGFVEGLLRAWPGRLVLDADGINALSDSGDLGRAPGSTILTPHHGEFQRFSGLDATYQRATALAVKTDSVVLLKGWPTFVADGADVWAVVSGGPELATVGTGDVLAGAIGALWARGLTAPVAARSGAYWHGVAGAQLKTRENVTASALAAELGRFVEVV